uniref:BCL2 associated transcription factor 1 n=1 Tax=Leptobrachium leishanense TaxID=445787 RepID=A0A8C5QUG5_9ANUR
MGRSNTRSHSSRSKSRSPSSSRSRSHSRKKRYSSRSRSRTHSRSRSRERVYNRDFHRDYRSHRGMRRPYGFRGRVRGYYQGGGRRYYRGGYRPMWNRMYSQSPRRFRSRSRSPKRRSTSTQRSRSRSYRSSPSPRSSSSRSSSHSSRSPVPKSRNSQDENPQRTDGNIAESTQNSKSCDNQKAAFDPSEPLDELAKDLDLHGEVWAGLSAYANSPRSPCSPSSPVASPPSQSSSCSDDPIRSVAHSSKDTSQNSHSHAHTPDRSGSGGNGSTRYSPSQNSPLHKPSCKSPTKGVSGQNNTSEGCSRYSYTEAEEQDLKSTKLLKRHTDEDNRLFPIEKVNTREKENQKGRGSDKIKKESGCVWEVQETSDSFREKENAKPQFVTISETEDLEEAEDYRQFRKAVLAGQGKRLSSTTHWNLEDEGTKYKTKVLMKGPNEAEKNRDGKGHKSASKDKHRHDGKNAERSLGKRDSQSPDQGNLVKMKDRINYTRFLYPNVDGRERTMFREESPLRMKMTVSESNHLQVKFQMLTVPLEDNRWSSMTNDRLLASTLVHSVKKVQEFRSIFDHLKVSFASKTSPEMFTYYIVSLVQHVKEHYFKGDGKTLSERFAGYHSVTEAQASCIKSPEIHRRIDISPNVRRKPVCLQEDEKAVNEEPAKVEKHPRSSSADQRCNVGRSKNEHGKERGDSKCSRESSSSRKHEKAQKDKKEYKVVKEDRKRRKDPEPSSSPSSGSLHEERDKKEKVEEFKGPLELKEFSGFPAPNRSRGTFFRIRGRARPRGVFAGTSTSPLNMTTYPKRPKEEDWDPEYTPKSKKYFLHDDRDDGVDYWARRARGRTNFQHGRGRFTFKKSGSSPKWTHDKYQGDGILEDEDEAVEDRCKDEKE